MELSLAQHHPRGGVGVVLRVRCAARIGARPSAGVGVPAEQDAAVGLHVALNGRYAARWRAAERGAERDGGSANTARSDCQRAQVIQIGGGEGGAAGGGAGGGAVKILF